MTESSEPKNEPVWWDGFEPLKLRFDADQRPRGRVRGRGRNRRV